MGPVKSCRICKSTDLRPFLSLGDQPHCNRFLTKEQLANGNEPKYPLDLLFCDNCKLVLLGYVVAAETMFKDYPYVSGTTRTLRKHFHDLAARIVERFGLKPGDLVVDVGSNDGTFLEGYRGSGVKTLGVDPATAIVKMANERGIETIEGFFGEAIASQIVRDRGRAKVITAAGVFFHVDYLDDFVRGVKTLLTDDGVFMVQAVYLLDMIEQNSFDNVYHEHVCYYSLRPLVELFRRFDMEIVDVERTPIHGGSFLAFVQNRGGPHKRRGSVDEILKLEERLGFYSLPMYQEFARRVERNREALLAMLRGLKADGQRLAAFGAPAKGNTLLNYCGIGTDLLDYASEKNPLKCGLYTPGMHIPVISEEEAAARLPDYYLLLPWNFKDEILEKERPFRDAGGRFVVPIPEPQVV